MNTIGLQGQVAIERLAQNLYLEAAAASIYLGTSEVHRTIISALDSPFYPLSLDGRGLGVRVIRA